MPAQGSRQYRECMIAAGTQAGSQQACLRQEAAYQDRVLNALYQERMAVFAAPRRAALRERQRAWVRQTESECDASTVEGQACRLARTIAQIGVLDAEAGSAAGQADTRSARGRPDARGALTLRAGDAKVTMASAQCSGQDRLVCSQAQLRVDLPEVSGQSLVQPEVVFGSGSGAGGMGDLYRGSLEQGFVDGWPTFAVSDINGDAHEDLLVWSGSGGSYGDPSYTWYLYDARVGKLVENHALAKLVTGHTVSRIVGNRVEVWYRSGPCERGEKIVEVRGNAPHVVESRRYDNCKGEKGAIRPRNGASP